MRIMLIQSYLGRREKLIYPLGLAYIGSKLLGDHELLCLDLNSVESPYDNLEKNLRDFEPECVGFSLRNIDTTQSRDLFYYYQSFIRQLNIVRELYSSVPILVGGSGFSLYAERIMRDNPQIDFGIYREGENTISALTANIEKADEVPGLYYRAEGQVVFSGPSKAADLAEIPPLQWDLFPLDPYRDHHGSFGVETKRGCILNCEYCTYPFLDGPVIRKHPVKRILDELETLDKVHGIKNFTFVDSVFNIPPEHSQEICQGIIERKISLNWVGWFNEKNLNRDFMILCRDAGCVEFSFSPDGFSDRALKGLGKNIKKKDILRVFNEAIEIPGVNLSYNFVANPPGQDLLSFLQLFLFMIRSKLVLRNRLKGFCITNLRIEPNTGIYERAKKENILSEKTDLLPPTVTDLRKLFYSNPQTYYLNYLMALYVRIWSLRRWVKEKQAN